MKSLLGKPQTILASLYTPGQTWEKSASNHPDKPLQCPYGKNTFQKGALLYYKCMVLRYDEQKLELMEACFMYEASTASGHEH